MWFRHSFGGGCSHQVLWFSPAMQAHTTTKPYHGSPKQRYIKCNAKIIFRKKRLDLHFPCWRSHFCAAAECRYLRTPLPHPHFAPQSKQRHDKSSSWSTPRNKLRIIDRGVNAIRMRFSNLYYSYTRRPYFYLVYFLFTINTRNFTTQ